MQTTVYPIESSNTADHPKLAPLYDEEGHLDVWCLATGHSVRNDYGVSGSPVWYDIEDVEVEEFEINGVEYTFKQLTEKFGAELEDELHVICADFAVEKGDWE